jgi:hypothetical protein
MSDMKFLAAPAIALAALCACSPDSARDARPTDTAIASPKSATHASPGSANGSTRDEPLPPGAKLESGATIPNSDYVFRRVATPRGGAVWLDSMSRSGARTRRGDLALPPLAADERVMLASCDVNGRLDPFVVAIVVVESNVTRFTKVRQAWRANPAMRRFDIIPVAGVVCEDPGS